MSDYQDYPLDPNEKSLAAGEQAVWTVAHFIVSGMDSSYWAGHVSESLSRQKGVLNVRIDLQRKYTTVTFDPIQTNSNLLIRAIESARGNGTHRLWAELYLQIPAEAIPNHANTPLPA